jgi:hypothetical protein
MATLTVGAGAGFEYNTLSGAIAASQDGDVIQVQAGTYINDFSIITTSITIEGVGGLVNLVATVPPPDAKGILVIGTASSSPNVTLDNLEFSGAAISDDNGANGAGVRYQSGNLTINNSYFHGNQDGLLGTPEVNGTGSITINNTEFVDNGVGDPSSAGYGLTHNLYVGDILQLTVDNSYFNQPIVGNDIQSRAANTTIENSRIDDSTGTGSYEINLPNGGNDVVENNVIEKAPPTNNNSTMIAFGEAESGVVYAGSSLDVTGNAVLNNYGSGATFVWNGDTSTTATVGDNTTYGMTSSELVSGLFNGSGDTFASLSDAPALETSAPFICFCAGTLIATPRGDVLVDLLKVGDLVLTHSNKARPIVWIGIGRALATPGRRSAATPVILRKGALADNMPHRDLRVTKGHSLYVDNVLIPAEFLVNHRSILWDDRAQEVSIYHVELETHDVLVAEGAPAESYRDDGNRWLFRNANSGWDLPPQEACAPVLTGGPIVDAVWRRLLDRAGPGIPVPTTDQPDLHLLVDGRRLDGQRQPDGVYAFQLPGWPREVRVVSRSAVPAELGLARDPRILGVAFRRVMLWRGAELRLIEAWDTSLGEGFHRFEPGNGVRWTDGDANLPAALFDGIGGPSELHLLVGCTTRYPLFDEPLRAAAA